MISSSTISPIEKLKTKRIYVIEGNIGAGKTIFLQLIKNLVKDAEFVEEPVNQWQNVGGKNLLNAFYSSPERWGFSFEIYVMMTKIQSLFKAANSDKNILIVERSIFSDKIFTEISYDNGKLNKMEYAMFLETLNFYINHIYPELTGIIYLDTPVEECIKRIKSRNRPEEKNIDIKYLTDIKTKLDFYCASLKANVIKINGIYKPKYDKEKIYGEILKILNQDKKGKNKGGN